MVKNSSPPLFTLYPPTHCPVEPTQMRKVKMRYNLEKTTSGGQSVEPTFSQSLSDFISLLVALTLFSPKIYRISLIFLSEINLPLQDSNVADLSRFFVFFCLLWLSSKVSEFSNFLSFRIIIDKKVAKLLLFPNYDPLPYDTIYIWYI